MSDDTNVVYLFKNKPVVADIPPDVQIRTIALNMMRLIVSEADRNGIKIDGDVDFMMDFEVIYRLIKASLARSKNIKDSYQYVLDRLIQQNNGA